MRLPTDHDLRVLGESPKGLPRLRYLWWRCVRSYDSELCHACGRPYFEAIGDTYWHADDALWLFVEGGPGGLRCPPCFTRDCRAAGIAIYWQPIIDTRLPAPARVSKTGAVA